MRIWFNIIIMCSFSLLAALNMEYPSGHLYELSFQDYPEDKLQSVVTTRSSEGGMITETWKGVSLQALLEKAGETSWDLARIKSKDNYETTVNRAELNPDTAFLALFKNGLRLSDYDVRIIFPRGHESTWIRNLQSIKMESISSLPPLYIKPFETLPLLQHPENSGAAILLADLVQKGLRLTNAEIVIITTEFTKYSLKYPQKQRSWYLQRGPLGEYYFHEQGETSEGLPQILYIQIANIGFIDPAQALLLPKVAGELGWDWSNLDKTLGQYSSQSRVETDAELKEFKGSDWLELKSLD